MRAHQNAFDLGRRQEPEPWYQVAILVLLTVLALLDRQVLSLLVGPIRHDLHITDTQIGLLQGAAFSVFYSIAGLPLGWYVDRVNRRNLLLVAVLIWSLMTVVSGMASTYWELFAARVGVGIGEACLLPASYSLVSDFFSIERRGRAAGLLYAGVAVGSGASLVLGAAILRLMKSADALAVPVLGRIAVWQYIFILIGLAGLPISLLLLTFREPPRRGTRDHAAVLPGVFDFLVFFKQTARSLVPVMCTGMLVVCGGAAASYWGPTALTRRFDLPMSQAGLGLGIAMLIGGSLGPVLGGTVTDRWVAAGRRGGRLRIYVLGVPISVLGISLLSFGKNPSWAYCGMALAVLGSSALASASFTATQDLCPNQFRGQAIALTNVGNNMIGISLGPLAVAVVTQYGFSQDSMLSVALGFVAIPLFILALMVALAGIVLWKNVRITRVSDLDSP